MLTFPDIEKAAITFGDSARAYGPMINEIAPYLFRERYVFEDDEVFKSDLRDPKNGAAYAGRVYWHEILNRAHLNAVTAIIRTCRWADVAVREQDSGNLFGWAAACRSLMEAAGDTGHGLGSVPLTLATLHREIKAALKGTSSNTVALCEELENTLIHFSHARKIAKTQAAPESHKARQSAEYIGFLVSMKIAGVRDAYADFCEIVHPAEQSVSTLVAVRGKTWVLDANGEQISLETKAKLYRTTMEMVLVAALNPPILILKILDEFDVFTKIEPIRSRNLVNIPLWKKMTDALNAI
jgi:hypothetical protein